MIYKILAAAAVVAAICCPPLAKAEGAWSANAGVTNNYLWRGLTQTQNDVGSSAGIDYGADNGFYAGTWVSNVSYAPGDVFSYEHDVYFGFAADVGAVSYDVGYLYYNYDAEAEFDFAEIYGSVSLGEFSAQVNLLAHTEADEAPGQDFGFGEAIYLSLDYATQIREGLELGIHVGWHDGDFNEAFNGVPEGYMDYGVSIAKDGFSFMISDTNLDDAGAEGLDNDAIKFVIGYSVEFDL